MSNSSTIAKLGAMVMLFLVSFTLYGLYCFNTVSEVKINGPFYQRIVQGKDVIADILPPPEYLIETYLTAYQMVDDSDQGHLAGYVAKAAKLRSDYIARHAFWETDLPEGEMKSILVRDSYAPAMRMLDTLEKAFIPALQAGDRAKAKFLLHGSLQKDYADHRMRIDRVVALAVERNRDDEARAAVSVKSRTFGQIGLGLCLFVLLSSLSWYLVNLIESTFRTAAFANPSAPEGNSQAKKSAVQAPPKSPGKKTPAT